MRNTSEKSFTLVVLWRPSGRVLVVFLDEGNKKREVRLVGSRVTAWEGKDIPPSMAQCATRRQSPR